MSQNGNAGSARRKLVFHDDQGHQFHALAEHRVCFMMDHPDCTNPMVDARSGKQYRQYPRRDGVPPEFYNLDPRAQSNRMSHWNEAQRRGLVKYDERYGLAPTNNGDAAAGTGQSGATAAAAAAPDTAAAPNTTTELLQTMTATLTVAVNTQDEMAKRQQKMEDRQDVMEGTQVEHAEHMSVLSNQLKDSIAQTEMNLAGLKDLLLENTKAINENKEKCGKIETTVQTLEGETKIISESCNDLRVITKGVEADIGNVVDILSTKFENFEDQARAFQEVFTPKGSRAKPSNFTFGSPTEGGGGFVFSPSSKAGAEGGGGFKFTPSSKAGGAADSFDWTSSPSGIEDIFMFGHQTNRKNFNFTSSLEQCLSDFVTDMNENLWMFAVGGSAAILNFEKIPDDMDVRTADDHRIMSLILVICKHPPTNLVVEQYTPEDCIPITTFKSLAEAGLEWSSARNIAGRDIRVLKSVNGHHPSAEALSKMRLLLGRPSELLSDAKKKEYEADMATVVYSKAKKDGDGNVIMIDGEVQFEKEEELLFNKGDEERQAREYIEDGEVDPYDEEAIVATAKMHIQIKQAGQYKTQALTRQLKIHETFEEIAALNKGTTPGHIRLTMDEMKIAQVFPSEETLDYDALGITKGVDISSVESPADTFYPKEDAKPAADKFSNWKPKGHGIWKKDGDDKDAEGSTEDA